MKNGVFDSPPIWFNVIQSKISVEEAGLLLFIAIRNNVIKDARSNFTLNIFFIIAVECRLLEAIVYTNIFNTVISIF